MLVHFPIAFWSLATVLDCCALLGVGGVWPLTWMPLALGLIIAVPAMILGLLEFADIEEAASRDAQRHMLTMCAAWVAYFAALLMRMDGVVPVADLQFVSIALSLSGFGLMGLGSWYGGQLVYWHGVGRSRR